MRHLYCSARRRISSYASHFAQAAYLSGDALLGSRLSETARDDGDPLGAALKALLQGVHGELGRDGDHSALNGVRDLAGRFVDGLVEQSSPYTVKNSKEPKPFAFTKYVLPLNL